MDSLQPQLEDLTSSIDDLESALSPILNAALSASTSKLPLLDKAKLYVLATYAIESILFSFIRLNGADAKSHPVFQELNRVRKYFQKINTAEEVGAGAGARGARLDKDAAGRFIKAGLSGNDRYDREREDRRNRERAGAKRKLEQMGQMGTHTRFENTAKKIKGSEGEQVTVVKASEADSEDSEDNDQTAPLESLASVVERVGKREKKQKKKREPLGGQQWKKAAAQMLGRDPEAALPADVAATEKQSSNKKTGEENPDDQRAGKKKEKPRKSKAEKGEK